MRPTVGFIGLGSQGGPMARRIVAAGFPTLLWARRAEALAPFADTAARIAASPADLAARCDLVAVCVVDDAGVRAVAAQLLPAMRAGSVLVIHSTVHPRTCLELVADAAARGIMILDAPVSGGGPGAAAGTLTTMVGGAAGALAIARPVFESFSSRIVHLGGVGAGQLAKLVNNALMAANMALGDAALRAGDALGIDRAALAELVDASSGRSYGFEVRARIPDLAGWKHGAALLAKDVGLLGAVLQGDPAFGPLRDAAEPFLAAITGPRTAG